MASRLLQIVPCQTKASSRFYTNYNVDKSKFKNVLVTGGSRGIGYIISESLAKRGMNVAVLSQSDRCFSSAEKINDIIKDERVYGYKCDVRNSSEVNETVKLVENQLGPVDILVNCAGIAKDSLLLYLKDEELEDLISTNLYGSLYVSRAVLKKMIKQKHGNIIMVGSTVGQQGNIGQVAYASSKAALIGAVKSMAKELGPKGIRTNLLSLGYFETDLTNEYDIEFKNKIIAKTSLKRLGKPSDVISALDFIIYNEFLNGEIINVDGGLIL